MKIITQILIAGAIYANIEKTTLAENGTIIWNVPSDLEEFKTVAIVTINWQAGQKIQNATGATNIALSTANSKAISLLAKLLKPTEAKLNSLTDLEKENFLKIESLGNAGYADSELLNNSLTAIENYLNLATQKIVEITKASSIDDVIDILNQKS